MVEFSASLFLFLAIIAAAYALLMRRRVLLPSDDRLRALRVEVSAAGSAASARLRRSQTSLPLFGDLLASSDWATKTETKLRQANVHLRVGEYLALRAGLGVALFFVILLVSRGHPLAPERLSLGRGRAHRDQLGRIAERCSGRRRDEPHGVVEPLRPGEVGFAEPRAGALRHLGRGSRQQRIGITSNAGQRVGDCDQPGIAHLLELDLR